MTEQVCLECGCRIGVDSYEKDGVLYCCRPCATDGQCQCGCYEAVKKEDK